MKINEWIEKIGGVCYGYTEESLPTSLNVYNQWIEENKHEPLLYLAGDRQQKRQDLKNYWSEFQSAVVVLFSYHETHRKLNLLYDTAKDWNGLKIASYTLGFEGEDYHYLLREKLTFLGDKLKDEYGIEYRLTIDTHPVLERDLAFRSGIGWFGKNSMLINRNEGSFFIIGSILLNKRIPLETKVLETDHCGQCSLCVENCPTGAIDEKTRTIVTKDCISTFTIEQFKIDTIPSKKMSLKSGEIFGCDICQDVCPWNKRVDRFLGKETLKSDQWNEKQKNIIDYFIKKPVEQIEQDLNEISNGEFERKFQKTSFERSGRRGLLKNIKLFLKKKRD